MFTHQTRWTVRDATLTDHNRIKLTAMFPYPNPVDPG